MAVKKYLLHFRK